MPFTPVFADLTINFLIIKRVVQISTSECQFIISSSFPVRFRCDCTVNSSLLKPFIKSSAIASESFPTRRRVRFHHSNAVLHSDNTIRPPISNSSSSLAVTSATEITAQFDRKYLSIAFNSDGISGPIMEDADKWQRALGNQKEDEKKKKKKKKKKKNKTLSQNEMNCRCDFQ